MLAWYFKGIRKYNLLGITSNSVNRYKKKLAILTKVREIPVFDQVGSLGERLGS